MNGYLDLVKEYGKVHRKKNRITVICIAIAVCLVTAIFGMADMEIRSQIRSQIKTNGNWHVMFKDIDDETAELIGSRVDVLVSGWLQRIDDGMLQDKSLAVIGGEPGICREMGIDIEEGRFPKNSNEALLDRQAIEQFAISVDDEVSVTLSDQKSYNYNIVGIYRDFATLKAQDAHGLLLSNEGIRKIGNTKGNCYYVQFKSGTNMRGAIDEIKKAYNLTDEQIAENTVLLGMIGQSRDNYMVQLYTVAAVLFILVLIAGVLMIASSFNMNFLERIQFFGLLRCLGASKKQVKRYVLYEGIRFSLRGIPLGLVIGTIIVWIACGFLKYVNPTFFKEMPLFGFSIISIIAGIGVGFLTVILASLSPCRKAARVSPLAAVNGNINQNNVPQAKKAVNTRLPVDTAMGIHHAFTSKKNIFLMTGSFAISIILFLSFSVLVNFMYQAVRPLKPYTPDLSIISENNTCSLEQSLFEQIKNNPEVKRAYGRMFAYNVPVTSAQSKSMVNLISYEEQQFRWAKKQLVQGSISEVADKVNSVLVVYEEDMKWQIGDTLTLKFPSGEEKVKISGILATSPFNRAPGTQTLICSEKTFHKLTGEQGYTIIDMQLAKGTDDQTVAQIRGLLTPQMGFSDRRQSNEEVKAAFYSFAIFIYGFLIIIALITVFNIINSMNNSVSSRIKQYGIMRAVGMSFKQLHRMVTVEAATYAVCGCLAGGILGLPIHRFLYISMITSRWGLQWHPPYLAIIVIVGIAILTTFLSVIRPARKISNTDIVEVVNAQ